MYAEIRPLSRAFKYFDDGARLCHIYMKNAIVSRKTKKNTHGTSIFFTQATVEGPIVFD